MVIFYIKIMWFRCLVSMAAESLQLKPELIILKRVQSCLLPTSAVPEVQLEFWMPHFFSGLQQNTADVCFPTNCSESRVPGMDLLTAVTP